MREEQTLPEMRDRLTPAELAFEWRYYQRDARDPSNAELLKFFTDGFNAGIAEGGKDAERYRVLKPMFVAANFHPEDLDLGGNGVVLMFLAPDEITVCSDLDDVIDSAIACLPTPPAAMPNKDQK